MTEQQALAVVRDFLINFVPAQHEMGYLPRNEDEQGWHRGAGYVCDQAVALIDKCKEVVDAS